MGYCAKVSKQPKKPMTPAGDKKWFYCHKPGHFKCNYPMIASKSADGADPRPSTNACKKLSTLRQERPILSWLSPAGCAGVCWTLEATLRYFLMLSFVYSLSIKVDLSAAISNSIPILGAVTVTVNFKEGTLRSMSWSPSRRWSYIWTRLVAGEGSRLEFQNRKADS